jgi:hypothetical protein
MDARASLLDFLHASAFDPPSFDSLDEFLASKEPIGMATAAWPQDSAGWNRALTSSLKPSCLPPARPRVGAKSRSRSAMLKR